MIRASRVGGDRAAPDGGNGEMAAVSTLPGPQLELAYQVAPDGKATVRLRGELDIATADQAYAYLRDVVDGQDGPVTVNLSELSFCDAGRPRGAGPGCRARAAFRPFAQADRRPPLAAADHAHHRHGRGVSRGPQPHPVRHQPAPPGHE